MGQKCGKPTLYTVQQDFCPHNVVFLMSKKEKGTSKPDRLVKVPKASKFRGVYKCGKKWKSQIQIQGQQIYLGVFDSEVEAAEKFNDAVKFNSKPSQFLGNPEALSDLSSDNSEGGNICVKKSTNRKNVVKNKIGTMKRIKCNTPNDPNLILQRKYGEKSVKFMDSCNKNEQDCNNVNSSTADAAATVDTIPRIHISDGHEEAITLSKSYTSSSPPPPTPTTILSSSSSSSLQLLQLQSSSRPMSDILNKYVFSAHRNSYCDSNSSNDSINSSRNKVYENKSEVYDASDINKKREQMLMYRLKLNTLTKMEIETKKILISEYNPTIVMVLLEKLDNIQKSQVHVVEEAKKYIVPTIPNMVSEIEFPENKSTVPLKKRGRDFSSLSPATTFQSPNSINETFSPIFSKEGRNERSKYGNATIPASFLVDGGAITPTTIDKCSIFDFEEYSTKAFSVDGLSALISDEPSEFSSIGTIEMMFADSNSIPSCLESSPLRQQHASSHSPDIHKHNDSKNNIDEKIHIADCTDNHGNTPVTV